MTNAEALKFAEEMHSKLSYRLECAQNVPARSYYEKQDEMLIRAIVALREQEKRTSDQPLTIEELRQMNGQPVWIAEENAWGIVSVDSCGIHEGQPFAKFRYNTIWCEYDIERRNLHCYRHKPQEVQK